MRTKFESIHQYGDQIVKMTARLWRIALSRGLEALTREFDRLINLGRWAENSCSFCSSQMPFQNVLERFDCRITASCDRLQCIA
jgi:hypothetical protein